jgi:DnaK suppressor protein
VSTTIEAALVPRLAAERTRLEAELAALRAGAPEPCPTDLADLAEYHARRAEEGHRTTVIETRLTEVRDALRRVDAGSFGRCEVCGEPIEPARLEAVPTTTVCAKDAAR